MKLIKIADSVYINPSHVVRAYTGEAWSENQRKTVPYTHVVMSDGNTELTALSLEALAEILGEVEISQEEGSYMTPYDIQVLIIFLFHFVLLPCLVWYGSEYTANKNNHEDTNNT